MLSLNSKCAERFVSLFWTGMRAFSSFSVNFHCGSNGSVVKQPDEILQLCAVVSSIAISSSGSDIGDKEMTLDSSSRTFFQPVTCNILPTVTTLLCSLDIYSGVGGGVGLLITAVCWLQIVYLVVETGASPLHYRVRTCVRTHGTLLGVSDV